MPFTDLMEQQILDDFFSDAVRTNEDLWIGLSTTTPTDAGTNVTEPSTGSYARVALATTAGGSASLAAATGTAPADKANGVAIPFPTATGDWSSAANMTHFVVFNAASAGTCRAWGALTVAKPVLNGDTASFAIGALHFKLGKGTAG